MIARARNWAALLYLQRLEAGDRLAVRTQISVWV
jgi:hypothetical protein